MATTSWLFCLEGIVWPGAVIAGAAGVTIATGQPLTLTEGTSGDWGSSLVFVSVSVFGCIRTVSFVAMPASAKEVTGRNSPRVRVSKSKLLCIEYRDFLEAIKILLYHLSVNLYSVIKSNRKAF